MPYGPPIRFWVPGRPVPKGRPRVVRSKTGKPVAFTPKETLEYEKKVGLYARAAGVTVAMRPRRFLLQLLLCLKNPWVGDGDNYEKAIADALNGVAWEDDVQVFDCIRRKVKATGEVGVKVIIQEIL